MILDEGLGYVFVNFTHGRLSIAIVLVVGRLPCIEMVITCNSIQRGENLVSINFIDRNLI